MTYWISAVYKTILLIFCLGLVFQTLSRFFKIKERLTALSLADAELIACAQRKANLSNVEDAYYFLSKQNPGWQDELAVQRRHFEDRLRRLPKLCKHPFFQNIQAAEKKQKSPSLQSRWPNWILAIEERDP